MKLRNLEDLRIVMKGFNGIIEKLKEVNEVHDFDDIQRMAGDLLLANCPKICEKFLSRGGYQCVE